MKVYCQACHKELKATDWITLDYANKMTHCTCINFRNGLIKDLDTYQNIKNNYFEPQLGLAN